MGKFGHHNFEDQNPNKSQRSSTSSNGKAKKNPIKVTYISSPMKVKASNASEFRAIVQELTGKNSDVTTTAAVIPVDEKGNQAKQHTKIVSAPAADEFLWRLTSGDHQLQFDHHERFFWRDVSADSSFGIQSPNCFSLYDCTYTPI